MTQRLPAGWKQDRLDAIAELERATVTPQEIREGTKYVGLEHIDSSGAFLNVPEVGKGQLASNKFAFSNTHILYGKLRPYLTKIARPDFSGVCSTEIIPIRTNGRLNRDYLYYYLRQPRMVTLANTRTAGANLPRLSPTDLASFPISYPESPMEQQRLTYILDEADALRRKRTEAIRVLERLSTALFLDQVGDPIRNPKAWQMSTFGNELADLEYGPRFYNESYTPDGVRIVRITDLDAAGNIDFSSMPRLEVEPEIKAARCLKPGDIILARSGATVGKSALIKEGAPECIAGAYFIRLQFKKTVRPQYVKMLLDTTPIQTIIAQRSVQSAQQNFSGPGIRALPLPLPPVEVQLRLETAMADNAALAMKMSAHRIELDNLFQSLLQRAFRGDL